MSVFQLFAARAQFVDPKTGQLTTQALKALQALVQATGGDASGNIPPPSTINLINIDADLTALQSDVDAIQSDVDDLQLLVAVSVNIDSTDSPYTQVNKCERIYADATGGAITVNLLPVATDIYCDVIKTDSSANTVTVASTDLINGESSQALLYQFESIEMAGNTSGYIVV